MNSDSTSKIFLTNTWLTLSFDTEEVWEGKKKGGEISLGFYICFFVDQFFDQVEAHKALCKCSVYVFRIDSYVDFHR